MISALSREFDVVLISLLSRDQLNEWPLPKVDGVWKQCAFHMPSFDARSASAVLAATSKYPRSVAATWSRDTARCIEDAIRVSKAQVVIGTDMRTARYLGHVRAQVPGIRTILDEPDVSPFLEAPAGASAVERQRSTIRRRKYQRFLMSAGAGLDAVVVASRHEADAFAVLSGEDRTIVIENGISTFPSPWRAPNSATLLYTGSLTYGPNAEAVQYLINDILPHIALAENSVRLVVTGRLPDTIPDTCRHPRVEYTGRLDRLDPIYHSARVFVAPILSGTGTRIKILEAMAIGMPVVTTSKGIEGIPATSGQHVLIVDDPAMFADAVVRIITDDSLANQLGVGGRAFVQQHANWESSANRLCSLVRQLLNSANRG
jgi:glycosyltransferase involved in cell wall biosynthesis